MNPAENKTKERNCLYCDCTPEEHAEISIPLGSFQCGCGCPLTTEHSNILLNHKEIVSQLQADVDFWKKEANKILTERNKMANKRLSQSNLFVSPPNNELLGIRNEETL